MPLLKDVRVAVEVECFSVEDQDAAVCVAVRETEDRHAIAAWLSREDALRLAESILVCARSAKLPEVR